MGHLNVHVRCNTHGALICGQRLRAGQDIDLEVDDIQIIALRIAEAAGDITATGLPDETSAIKRPALTDFAKDRDAK